MLCGFLYPIMSFLSYRSALATLASRGARSHAFGMFVVTEADAAAIRAIFHQGGELSAAIELRRRLPGITDNAKAGACARSIAGWTPLPVQPRPVARLRPHRTASPASRPGESHGKEYPAGGALPSVCPESHAR
jgi:hypothetical protein